jgi:hypothetical protein
MLACVKLCQCPLSLGHIYDRATQSEIFAHLTSLTSLSEECTY